MPLLGTWIIWCPNGHQDEVNDVTDNHDCTVCGNQTVNGGAAIPVCPNGHHVDIVGGVTTSHLCSVCGDECRR